MAVQLPQAQADPGRVLTRAVLRAGDFLGLSRAQLGRAIGKSEATMSRMAEGRTIDPDTKEGELALMVIRVFRSLDTLFGGNIEQCRAWLEAYNHHLNERPTELIQTAGGLVHVADYLDAMRG